MERIRKALEQASRERAETGATDTGRFPRFNVSEPDLTAGMKYTHTRVVEVPKALLLERRVIAAVPEHELRDSYRMLRTRVLQTMREKGWNSLAVTGPASGCGKTLTAINLAVSLAMEVTSTVLLVDLDLRKPSIHEYFGYQPEFGISDYLFNDVKISEMLFSPAIDRLVVLPGREPIHNSSEMLRSPRMVRLVTELKTRYPERLVVFDLPPVLAADDALAFAPYTDGFLLVAESGGTSRDDMEKALSVLKGTPIIGTVLNKTTAPSRGGYGYRAPAR